jgi:phytoene dehydrogenase-like protein
MSIDPATFTPDNAVVIGAGPNGLTAAIRLAQDGKRVRVLEANDTIGGGSRSAELTLPGFLHDTCSAIHPTAYGSPFLQTLPLASHGLEWVHPTIPLAHPFDDGTAAIMARSITETGESVGTDAQAWRGLFGPLVDDFELLLPALLGPFRPPRHPIALARFGFTALRSGHAVAKSRFDGARARGLFAGLAAHSILDLDRAGTAAFGLVLGLFGHSVGWPIAVGGSQRIADALAAHLASLGGVIETGHRVTSLDGLDEAGAIVFDTGPANLAAIAGSALPDRYLRQLGRYRYGSGVHKIDWALDGPVPWTAPECGQAGTLHLGGTMEEIVFAEKEVAHGRHPERPFVLIAQQSLFDSTRAPAGHHTLWGYCHVPNGSTVNMTDRIEAQIERFAPGFRERIIGRSVMTTSEIEARNANYIGGDINIGMQDLRQLYTRPAPRLNPYTTPNRQLYIGSSATPPGGGVHGMSGFHAAESALRRAWQD